MRLRWLIGTVVLASTLVYTSFHQTDALLGGVANAQSVATCNLSCPAFCDTFDNPFPTISRTGQLNPTRWSVAHVNTGVNADQGQINTWTASDAMHCKTPVTGVLPPNDYFMCGPEFGESMHFMEALNDDSAYIYNSEMILQPFDFSQTGTIAFDVDAKNSGSHGWWIEVWITPDPVPGPHNDVGHIQNLQNGLGLFFQDDCLGRGGTPQSGENGSGATGMARIELSKNGVNSSASVSERTCFGTMPDMKNHIEIRLNQNHLEVWASDPMMDPNMQVPSANNFRLVSTADNLGLPFSRGFVHFQDSHYDAEKAFGCNCVSDAVTYHWDNIGFDGPVLPAPAKFSIPDALALSSDGRHVSLGYVTNASGLERGPLTFGNVALNGATSATLTFNAYAGSTVNYR